ncbi:S8 family serine peptidase [Rufibacter roseolus]|uniref:S8 family serine peptidase n=1 Tax=Rufibacter roseolus TaxID=2817375 RepID=UPI001B314178|nr:S8 family serine peptidase [Rufibacter roseolus]
MGNTFTRNILSRLLGSVWFFSLALSAVGQTSRGLAPDILKEKLAPALRHLPPGQAKETIRVQVKDKAAFQEWLKAQLPQVRQLQTDAKRNTFLLSARFSEISLLTHCPFVSFIDVGNRAPQEEAHLQNSDLTVNGVEAVHLRYPQLQGENLVVSIKEQPYDPTDIDFKGRVLAPVSSTGAPTPHATSMATLVAGGGNTSPAGKGVAWQSQVMTSDFTRLMPDETSFLQSSKISVQNHSYGVGLENYYGLESQAYDAQVLEYPQLLHFFSSGNAGTQTPTTGPYAGIAGFANLTGQFKISKNTLSVGAVDTSGQVSVLSSRGPTADGRIKPEVVAFGESGSSEASAVVSGVALLLQQAYQEQHNGALPFAALVKAALINSADDKGRPGPDYEAGFGNVDAMGAVESVLEKRYFEGVASQGKEKVFSIAVPTGAAGLKVTLVWHDAAAEPSAAKALVNDLDLTVQETSTGRKWLPWGLSAYPHKDSLILPARRQVDRRNNVEQVSLTSPAAGDYKIKVAGTHVTSESQPFSIVYEFEAPFIWTFPTAGSSLKSSQKNRIRWQAPLANGTTARLEYRWAGQDWKLIQDNVPLQEGKADWLTPDSAGLVQLRLVPDLGEALLSQEFVLSPVLPLQVGYQCEEEVLLFWPKATGANQYQVFALGEKYLEPVTTVSDTLLIFSKRENAALHFAVAPVIAGQTGLKSLTVNYADQGGQCYVKQFLARQLVTDSVQLDVELSTLYGLANVVLEKRTHGTFQAVQSLWPMNGARTTVSDPAPVPGRNEYRLRLQTAKGQTYYSHLEAVFYAPESFLQVFPNPVLAGDEVQLVLKEDELTRIQVFDQTGRMLKEIQQDGAIKVIKTEGLKAGIYLLKVWAKSGYKTTRLVLI